MVYYVCSLLDINKRIVNAKENCIFKKIIIQRRSSNEEKIVIVSLLAATMVIPSTSAFASDNSTEVINPNTQFTQESQITSGSGDVITPMSIDYRVNHFKFQSNPISYRSIYWISLRWGSL